MTRRPLDSLRSATAVGPLLVRRRIRRDGALLTVWTLTVAFAALLAIAGPAHLTRTVDAGARDAASAAGDETDLVIETPVSEPDDGLRSATVRADETEVEAEEIGDRLPAALRGALAETTVTVTGPPTLLTPADIAPAPADANLRVRLGLAMLTAQNLATLDVVEGALPDDAATGGTQTPVPVLVSRSAAAAALLAVGSVIVFPGVETDAEARLEASVVGIVEQRPDGASRTSPWRGVDELWNPTVLADGATTFVGITALVPSGAVDRITEARGAAFRGELRYSFDPSSFTARSLLRAADDSARLVANDDSIGGGYPLEVTSGFAEAVADFPDRVRATLAELSIVTAGVVGGGALVLLLVSRLLVTRRSGDVLLQRARGASLAAIALRTLAESVITVGVALIIAVALARATGLDSTADTVASPATAPLNLVVAVGLLAGVVQTLMGIRAIETLSRGGVDRRNAALRRQRRRVARVAVEAGVLAVAAAACVALLDRGLLQTASSGVDPLVAAAPLLLAAAVAVVVLRVSSRLARLAATTGGRGRGVAGPLISSGLRRDLGALPLAALTVAIALVVGTGLIGQTVRDGQIDASWQVVGADARVDGRFGASEVASVGGADGVVATSALNARSARLALGTSGTGVTLLSFDSDYARLVARLPDIDGVTDAGEADELAALSPRDGAAGEPDQQPGGPPVPVLVDSRIAERLISDEVTIALGEEDVPLEVVGVVRSGPVGYLDGPLVYADLASMSSRVSAPLVPNTLLALGPGAADAVERLELDDAATITRAGWIDDRRGLALVAGVEQAFVAGALVLSLLALAAIVCTALAGSPQRARHLALLRTLGADRRLGVLLAAVDQTPLMLASLAGGLIAGLGIAVLLAPALGLASLAGGVSSPHPSVPPMFLALVVAGVVVAFAVGTLIEVLLRRRDRVSDVIRVGETI